MTFEPFTHAGITASVAARRRYGNTTYTWIRFNDAEGNEYAADPWPSITPKRSEVKRECERIAKEHKTP